MIVLCEANIWMTVRGICCLWKPSGGVPEFKCFWVMKLFLEEEVYLVGYVLFMVCRVVKCLVERYCHP